MKNNKMASHRKRRNVAGCFDFLENRFTMFLKIKVC